MTLKAGTKTNVGVTAAALDAIVCFNATIQADPDNTVDVFIGDSASQPVQLTPGQSVPLPISNLEQVYVKTASGTATVNWLIVQ